MSRSRPSLSPHTSHIRMGGFLALFALGSVPAAATDWFAGPAGKADNSGRREAPWDLFSALRGRKEIAPGDTLWVRGGTYRGRFEVRLAGGESAPIHVRVWPGERATILDGTLTVLEPTRYLWMWDLEIAGSAPVERRKSREAGPWPKDLPGGDGLNVHAGKGCKYINLVIHDNLGNGVGWWEESTESEFHGCIIYNNGWKGADRDWGHCIYAQNSGGLKTVSHCIMSVPAWGGAYSMHAYGSTEAFVDNFLLEGNIVHERGPFLVGGGRPSRNIRAIGNYLYGVDLRIGYNAEVVESEVKGNLIVNAGLNVRTSRTVQTEGNRVLSKGDVRPARGEVVLLPNKYDRERAHLAVFNWERVDVVKADTSGFLKTGDKFRVLEPTNLFGESVVQGVCEGPTIPVPVKGEFAAYLILKGRSAER